MIWVGSEALQAARCMLSTGQDGGCAAGRVAGTRRLRPGSPAREAGQVTDRFGARGCGWPPRRAGSRSACTSPRLRDRQRKTGQLLTTCYNECMSVNVSVRLDDTLAERLRLRARAAGESLSDRLRRYAEEGSRRDEHPLITFRDGPVGRRAAVVGGPDVWEIVMWLEDLASEGDPVRVLAAEQDISRPLIDAALRYRDAYPDEVEARIALHRHDTAAADAR
jgi:hypothetical protein